MHVWLAIFFVGIKLLGDNFTENVELIIKNCNSAPTAKANACESNSFA